VPNANVSSAYFALVLLTAKGELNNRGRGSTFLEISGDELSRFSVPTPSFAEQTQIARFLDHETARIDALIEEQQRLIELLKEKRQAVISHAVTKGLDPTVSMKDSGVEWLGEVPAHWVVKSMKRLVEDGESVSYGIVQPGDHKDEGVPFIQTTNMSSGDFSFDALQRTSPEIEANYPRSRLHGGEVILGIRATIGAAFVIPESLKNINLSRGVARIECSEQVLAGYLVYFLSGRAAFEYWGLAKQGSTFSEVSIATVRELPVTVPPLIEQQELIDHMEQGTKRLDDLTLTGERTMALLRERRSALISAAVTGKIDVRGWKPPTSALSPELEKEAV
jgi:type I restriction enzyme S subunit